MKRTLPRIIDLDMDRLESLLGRAERALNEEDYETIKAVVESYAYIAELVGEKNITIQRLRKMLFGARTEKTATVVGKGKDSETLSSGAAAVPAEVPLQDEDESHTPRAGHGRNGAEAYRGAEKIEVPHGSLQPGDSCPECQRGTVYQTARPGVLVRIVGQAPVQAKVYQLQKLRCNLCGKVFTAQPPEEAGAEKYDATAGSMISLLKYGSGMPFNRLEGLQGYLGLPLPASTQWDLVHALAEKVEPVYEELIRQAAQGEVLHNDDTTIRILELMGQRAKQKALAEGSTPERTGLFTSGIVSTREGRRIGLFFSGRKHAGENLADVLAQRAADLGAPIQMCDALSRNLPGELETIVANCLAHGRRQFVDVAECFPAECRQVLESLAVIYRNDALARKQNLSPEARLHFHQAESGATMQELHVWLTRQFDQRLVERNSSLGGAIAYMLKHWQELTLFLRKPGAPLDNNICERVLKKAILHRKNALFYKTCHGAHVGDVFMSLIFTCEFCEANPFDYLAELDRHADCTAANPQEWLPWNYQETLERRFYAQTSSEESRQDDGCCGKAAQGAGETHETRAD
jgi:transposase